MRTFAIYGKGGSGKSTIAANLSVQFAEAGRRTLQIGCDPKRDSTLSLTGGKSVPAVIQLMQRGLDRELLPGDFVHEGAHGVSCIETGGPEAGVGCAGRGIVSAFNLIRKHSVLDGYDAVLLDVLGDVVCGGFATPLMHGMASAVAIVVSDNLMSMYAANNIARAIRRFERNGAHLAGLLANNSRGANAAAEISEFASRLGTRVIATFPHDEGFREAERARTPLCDLAPDSELTASFTDLAAHLWELQPSTCPTPTTMDDEELSDFFRSIGK